MRCPPPVRRGRLLLRYPDKKAASSRITRPQRRSSKVPYSPVAACRFMSPCRLPDIPVVSTAGIPLRQTGSLRRHPLPSALRCLTIPSIENVPPHGPSTIGVRHAKPAEYLSDQGPPAHSMMAFFRPQRSSSHCGMAAFPRILPAIIPPPGLAKNSRKPAWELNPSAYGTAGYSRPPHGGRRP